MNNILQHKDLAAALEELFNVVPKQLKVLQGYDNKNYLISTEEGQWIVKTYNSLSLKVLLEEESRILNLLNIALETPSPKKSKYNRYVEQFEQLGNPQLIRIQSFVRGYFMAEVIPTKALYTSLGKQTAKLSKALGAFQSPLIQCRLWDWHLNATAAIKNKVKFVQNTAVQRGLRFFIQHFEQKVIPQQPYLPQQLLHNDLNECNLLVTGEKISGCIDFGDIAYGPRIYELAIAMAYASYDKTDYLLWGSKVLEGYAKGISLQKEEVALLYYIIAMRLCVSLCNSAEAKQKQPENTYAVFSEQNMEQMLLDWIALGPIKVTNRFYKAAGLKSAASPEIHTLVKERNTFFGTALSLSYTRPIHVKAAGLQFMYCADGTALLDAYNNIPHVGHNHPKVVAAAQKQMITLNTNTRYVYDELHEYAAHLLSYFPNKLNRVFFVNSGSEASDLAIRMAKAHTAKTNIAVVAHGYHGHTQTGIEISDYKFNHPKGIGQANHILKLPLVTKTEELQQNEFGDHIEQLLAAPNMAAFISETILGCAGQVPLAKGYLAKVYAAVRAKGGVCIADEVQTGFGRTGTHFWAFEQQQVVPDMVLIGKPMGNGHPMGAVICTTAIATSFSKGVEFFSSFGGNPVSCAIGKAVLEVIEEEQLQKAALETGKYYFEQLKSLQEKFDCISEVRGSGLFLGIALETAHKKAHTELAFYLKNYLRENNVLISTDGPGNNVLKTKPPLCFSKQNVDQVVHLLETGLNKYTSI